MEKQVPYMYVGIWKKNFRVTICDELKEKRNEIINI